MALLSGETKILLELIISINSIKATYVSILISNTFSSLNLPIKIYTITRSNLVAKIWQCQFPMFKPGITLTMRQTRGISIMELSDINGPRKGDDGHDAYSPV